MDFNNRKKIGVLLEFLPVIQQIALQVWNDLEDSNNILKKL